MKRERSEMMKKGKQREGGERRRLEGNTEESEEEDKREREREREKERERVNVRRERAC